MTDNFSEEFIKVYETEDSEPIEIPIEIDDTVLFSTLSGQFPRVSGLKYKPPNASGYRAVKLSDGKLYKPIEGWYDHKLICVFAKEGDNKRKFKEDNELYGSIKTKRLENNVVKKCTDLIVLNLGWKVDEDALKKYFGQWGDVVLAQVKRERESNQSRGYGFVRFADYESQVSCLMVDRHIIDGRICAVKVPFSKTEADKQEISKKIHVSYGSDDITADDLRRTFEEYGSVCDIFIPKPFRNFAFVTFDSSEPVQQLIGQVLEVNGHQLTIGSAVPKITGASRQLQMQHGNSGGRMQYGYNYNNAQSPHSMLASVAGQFQAQQQFIPRTCEFGGNVSGRWEQSFRRGGGGGGGRYQNQQQPQYFMRGNIQALGNQAATAQIAAQQLQAAAPDMGQNTAAMAALNILNNPDVVAAIVAAAANANSVGQATLAGAPIPVTTQTNKQHYNHHKYSGSSSSNSKT